MNSILTENKNQIHALCLKHKVKELYVFGSVLRDDFNEDSDIDMVVEFQPIELLEYSDNYFQLWYSIRDLFHRKVDLLESKALKNPYFLQSINQTKQKLYAA